MRTWLTVATEKSPSTLVTLTLTSSDTTCSMDTAAASASAKEAPLFITKWIDYSNKYGFGFQLSDRSVGVLFNDHSRISYSADRR